MIKMPKRTGPTDPNVLELIDKLKKKSAETNASLWKTVANWIEKSRRQRVAVNLSRITKNRPFVSHGRTGSIFIFLT